MGWARYASVVIGSAVMLMTAACTSEGEETGHPCPPGGCPDEELEDEHAMPELPPRQLERYYDAQIAWRECAMDEGLDLPEPPTFQEFAAEDASWWVGADLSPEEWNRSIVGSGGDGRVGKQCGEPATPDEFAVSDEALERQYDHLVDAVACLEAEGFPVDTSAPSVEEFVESGGANWMPAMDFHDRYGFPETAAWTRTYERCGNEQGLWLDAEDFEVDRAALRAAYDDNLELTACMEDAGLEAPEPPTWEEFVDGLGRDWSSSDIWEAVYRDNERGGVRAFADRIDQVCPEVS